MTATPDLQDLTITTIGQFFSRGGFMMWPILACSVVVLGLAFERYVSTRRRHVLPRLVLDAVGQVCAGQRAAAAAAIAASAAPAARVLAAGFRRSGLPLADVERGMADQIAREGTLLRAHVRGISLMAAVAPLCGLLGTVLGIARAFSAVQAVGANRAELLASGIGVALYTTIFGLMVAIPATVLSAHLQSRVRRLMLAMDAGLSPAVEHLAAPPPPSSPAQEESHAA